MTHLVVVGGSDAGISAAAACARGRPVGAGGRPRRRPLAQLLDLRPAVPARRRGRQRRGSGPPHPRPDRGHGGDRPSRASRHQHRRRRPRGGGARRPPAPCRFTYDALVLGTGATPQRPPIDGLDLEGVHLLHTVDDALAVADDLALAPLRRAVIVGGGYIGLEMAEALRAPRPGRHAGGAPGPGDGHRRSADRRAGRRGAARATAYDVRTEHRGAGHRRRAHDGLLVATCGRAWTSACRPRPGRDRRARRTSRSEEQARAWPLELRAGRMAVDDRMAASVQGGDLGGGGLRRRPTTASCPQPTYLPLGSTSHKQGRVAGENADRRRPPVCRGARHPGRQALRSGRRRHRPARQPPRHGTRYEARSPRRSPLDDHKRYYPGATDLTVRVCGDAALRTAAGARRSPAACPAQVAKRIDVFVRRAVSRA